MFWYDGKLCQEDTLKLKINEPGLLYGATVFTTLRVYGQSLQHPLTSWQAHCDRLTHSIEIFGWQLPNWQRLRQGAEALLSNYPVLRITVFADGREWITGRFLPEDLALRQSQGIVAWLADDPLLRRSLADHKTGNYLGAWMALQQAQKLGAKEAVLVDGEQNWLETSTGNLWGWKDGSWWTPSLDVGILPGIVRAGLIDWLQGQDIEVRQTVWSADLVRDFEAIAYTNSVVEVVPIQTILCQSGKLTFALQPALAQLRRYFQKYNT